MEFEIKNETNKKPTGSPAPDFHANHISNSERAFTKSHTPKSCFSAPAQ